MKILVLGSGGREHAICHRVSQSPHCERLFVLPGNAGTEQLATNLPGDPADVAAVVAAARAHEIELVIVGPEDPLAAGVVDALEKAGIRAFGPNQAGARLEADKSFAKQLMRQHAIPTAEARIFDDYALAREYIASRDEALVVKASGLARGKGVVVCDEPSDAILAAEKMLVKNAFGEAGKKIVVEERLDGREASLHAFVDGRTIYVFPPAQDYKRALDGDAGPNTGGMGSYCPTNSIDDKTMRQIEEQILVPTLDALVREGIYYRGVLYVGLMLTLAGPRVLEFNCRFGDPEAQVLLMRLKSDLVEVINAILDGKLDTVALDWDSRHAVCVVTTSKGYPESSSADDLITGLESNPPREDRIVFHAGTKQTRRGVVTNGGRVLGVTTLGKTRGEAMKSAYETIKQIRYPGMLYRRDIGA
ncbi:MAG: phosphoribosylamine--glycine ligase [Phycisphaerae bacterium]